MVFVQYIVRLLNSLDLTSLSLLTFETGSSPSIQRDIITVDSPMRHIFKVTEVSDTVSSILIEKKIVSAYRLLLVPDSVLETMLSEHYGDLLAVLQARRWIQAYRSRNGGKLPINWEDEFTTVSFQEFETNSPSGQPDDMFHTPESQGITKAWQSSERRETELFPSLIHLFANLSSSSGTRVFNTGYVHFEVNSGTDTMGDLFEKLTQSLRCSNQLPGHIMLDLQGNYSVDVFVNNSPVHNCSTRLQTTLGASCNVVTDSRNKYINFVVRNSTPRQKQDMGNINNVLMASQAAMVLPTKFEVEASAQALSFPKEIFNFLVDGYKDESLGV